MLKNLLPLLFVLALLVPQAGAEAAKKFNYDFKDAELAQVIRTLARDMNCSVRLGPEVRGKVTLKLVGVSAEEALNQVMALFGGRFNYQVVDTTLIVAAPRKLSQIPDAVHAPPVNEPKAPPYIGARIRRGIFDQGGYSGGYQSEGYDHFRDSGFQTVRDEPLSTFSIDVDTAAYSNLRRLLLEGRLPPKDAVRVEEMLNYFNYDYPKPEPGQPFSVSTEVAECPWKPGHLLLQVGMAAPPIETRDVPARNLVFLLDVSGSMNSPDKLPLLKSAAKMLVRTLRPQDRVSIVVYAGSEGVVLSPTSGNEQRRILDALDSLRSGGATNGGAGIQLAYKLAQENYNKDAINRVILATDGDFNVGITGREELLRLIEDKRKSGIFLTVLGFGTGNLKDSQMEQLADKGNGNYAYIDSLLEGRKVLVEQAGATLVTVAKDVKLQLEFNPLKVASYRLVGYENRRLNNVDFEDDTKDAGEMGAGHTVTALYEIVPGRGKTGALRYQSGRQTTPAAQSGEIAWVKVRYKKPQGEKSLLREFPISSGAGDFAQASENLRFAASVASAGMLLRNSEFKGDSSYEASLSWARAALGSDPKGYRGEFVRLMELARDLSEPVTSVDAR